MVEEILDTVGIENNEARFLAPPSGTYATWLDATRNRGADGDINIIEHEYTIELYSKRRDRASEQKIEEELRRRHIEYDKEDVIWLLEEDLYMIIYYFDYIEKRR